MLSQATLFLDSSALFAGVASATGAARALLLLSEAGNLLLTVSEQVLVETEHALARKVPAALPVYREMLRQTRLRVVRDPPPQTVALHLAWMAHPADVPILVAAMQAEVDYLVTFNRRHFLDDPQLAGRAGLRIGTPGDALAWLRKRASAESECVIPG